MGPRLLAVLLASAAHGGRKAQPAAPRSAPDAALQLWKCDGNASHQAFRFNRTALTLELGALCIGRSGNHQFAALLLSVCDQGDEGQRWNVTQASSASTSASDSEGGDGLPSDSVVNIESLMPGSDGGCIGASYPVASGAPLQLAPDLCGSSSLGQWILSAAETFRLKGTSSLCMDHGSTHAGAVAAGAADTTGGARL